MESYCYYLQNTGAKPRFINCLAHPLCYLHLLLLEVPEYADIREAREARKFVSMLGIDEASIKVEPRANFPDRTYE